MQEKSGILKRRQGYKKKGEESEKNYKTLSSWKQYLMGVASINYGITQVYICQYQKFLLFKITKSAVLSFKVEQILLSKARKVFKLANKFS